MRPCPVGADPGGCKHDSGGVRAGRARGRHGYCVRPPPGLRRLKTALTGKGGSRALFRRSSVLGAAGIGEFTGDSMRRSAVERQFEVLGDALDRVRRADSETSRRIPDLARVMGLWADLLSLKEPDPTIRCSPLRRSISAGGCGSRRTSSSIAASRPCRSAGSPSARASSSPGPAECDGARRLRERVDVRVIGDARTPGRPSGTGNRRPCLGD